MWVCSYPYTNRNRSKSSFCPWYRYVVVAKGVFCLPLYDINLFLIETIIHLRLSKYKIYVIIIREFRKYSLVMLCVFRMFWKVFMWVFSNRFKAIKIVFQTNIILKISSNRKRFQSNANYPLANSAGPIVSNFEHIWRRSVLVQWSPSWTSLSISAEGGNPVHKLGSCKEGVGPLQGFHIWTDRQTDRCDCKHYLRHSGGWR